MPTLFFLLGIMDSWHVELLSLYLYQNNTLHLYPPKLDLKDQIDKICLRGIYLSRFVLSFAIIILAFVFQRKKKERKKRKKEKRKERKNLPFSRLEAHSFHLSTEETDGWT